MNKFDILLASFDKFPSYVSCIYETVIFLIYFIVMLVDDTQGPVRNYCAAGQLISCINLVTISYAITNKIKMSKMVLLTLGTDIFVSWTVFAYLGGAVTGGSPIGVYNWISIILKGISLFMYIATLITIGLDYDNYKKYNENRETSESI